MKRPVPSGTIAVIAAAKAASTHSTATEARAGPVAFATANHGSIGRRE